MNNKPRLVKKNQPILGGSTFNSQKIKVFMIIANTTMQTNFNSRQLKVFMTIADTVMQTKRNICTKSQETLGSACGVGDRQIRNILSKLKTEGLIKCERRYKKTLITTLTEKGNELWCHLTIGPHIYIK